MGKLRLKSRSGESVPPPNSQHHFTPPDFILQSPHMVVGEEDLGTLQNLDDSKRKRQKKTLRVAARVVVMEPMHLPGLLIVGMARQVLAEPAVCCPHPVRHHPHGQQCRWRTGVWVVVPLQCPQTHSCSFPRHIDE